MNDLILKCLLWVQLRIFWGSTLSIISIYPFIVKIVSVIRSFTIIQILVVYKQVLCNMNFSGARIIYPILIFTSYPIQIPCRERRSSFDFFFLGICIHALEPTLFKWLSLSQALLAKLESVIQLIPKLQFLRYATVFISSSHKHWGRFIAAKINLTEDIKV